jgi:hypothetical protein
MGLKKFLKKARKTLGIPAITLGNVAKVGAAAATGGLGGAALALGGAALKSKLKNAAVGGIKQVVRSKAQKALVSRIKVSAPSIVPISSATAKPRAITMPGGAPLAGSTARPKRRVAAKPKAKAPKRSSGGRKPPKGGKDFKSLSASWKAAGKPGKWIDWVKSH